MFFDDFSLQVGTRGTEVDWGESDLGDDLLQQLPVTVEGINGAYKRASEDELKGYLGYSEVLPVSSAFKGGRSQRDP